jgi:hypothetical protein
MKLEFSRRFFEKKTQVSNFMKILPVEAEVFHADRRTDGKKDGRTNVTKLIVAFRNVANASSLCMVMQ